MFEVVPGALSPAEVHSRLVKELVIPDDALAVRPAHNGQVYNVFTTSNRRARRFQALLNTSQSLSVSVRVATAPRNQTQNQARMTNNASNVAKSDPVNMRLARLEATVNRLADLITGQASNSNNALHAAQGHSNQSQTSNEVPDQPFRGQNSGFRGRGRGRVSRGRGYRGRF